METVVLFYNRFIKMKCYRYIVTNAGTHISVSKTHEKHHLNIITMYKETLKAQTSVYM